MSNTASKPGGTHSWADYRNSSVPQRRFLDALTAMGQYKGLYAPRILYGGAGFGGKSYGLRTATYHINGVLRELGFPGRWGALFCRTYNDLADRHLNKFAVEFESHGLGRLRETRLKGLHFEFSDPTMGGVYLRNADIPRKYRGAEFDWILVDELTEFTQGELDDIIYALRSNVPLPFATFGAASNPDGPGHDWVRKLWIDKDFSGEPPGIDASQYHFIPARATDNPAFTMSVQNNLTQFKDPMLVKARWEGSWDLVAGSRFRFNRSLHTFSWQDFENAYGINIGWKELLSEPGLFSLIGGFDYGTDEKSASVFTLHALDYRGQAWTLAEYYWSGVQLRAQAMMMAKIIERLPIARLYCDPSLLSRESDGISRIDKFRQYGVRMIPAINDRVEGWATLEDLLSYRVKGQDIVEIPRWRIHEGCAHSIRFLQSAPRDDKNREDVSRKFKEDHAGDSLRYAFHSHCSGPTPQMGAAARSRIIHPDVDLSQGFM